MALLVSTMADVRRAGEAGALGVEPWAPIRGCIDYAVVAYACSLGEIAADPDAFDARWPEATDGEIPAAFRSVSQYDIWRRNVLTALEAASGVTAPSTKARADRRDDWRQLQDLALRQASLPQRERLSCLAVQAKAVGARVCDVTLDWACVTQDRLKGTKRFAFRAGIAALDTLHDIPAIASSGRLPARIGWLPKALSPNEAAPLPGRLSAAVETWIAAQGDEGGAFTPRNTRFAAGWYWRRVVDLGLAAASDDPRLDDLASQAFVDAVWTGRPTRRAASASRTTRDYRLRMLKILRCINLDLKDPRRDRSGSAGTRTPH